MHLCKHTNINSIPGCALQADACKCIFDHKYQIKVTDPVTGVSAYSGWQGGETQAGEDAIQKLFQTDNGCNCHSRTFPLGNCTGYINACFFWTTVSALANNQTSFRLFGHLASPRVSPTYSAVAATASDIEPVSLTLVQQMIAFDPSCSLDSQRKI